MTLPTLMTIFYAFFGRRRSRPHCARTTPHHEANNTQASAKTRFGTFRHNGKQQSQTHGRGASLSLSLSLSLSPSISATPCRSHPIHSRAQSHCAVRDTIPQHKTRRDGTKNAHKHTHTHKHRRSGAPLFPQQRRWQRQGQ